MTDERFDERMNQSDTTMWRIERDPALRTTIVALATLGATPDWERLRDVVADTSRRIPRLRQRVVDPQNGPPRWVPADVDLDFHLRRIGAPDTGDDASSLLELASVAAMGAFDKDRPLWEFTLVEGLTGSRSALLMKFHHCLTDGVGAMRLARLLFDDDADEVRPVLPAGAEDHPAGSARRRAARDNANDQARDVLVLATKAATAVPAAMAAAAVNPGRAANVVLGSARSVYKLVRPARRPLSPVMTGRGTGRRLATVELPIAALLAAGHAVDGTLNDAFLAAVTGGLRRYHEHHGTVAEHLRVTMPVNLRQEDDSVGNNRFSPVRFRVPVAEPDPRSRMETIGALARGWRREPGLPLTDIVAGTLNALPPGTTAAVLGSMLKAIDFVASNVPGFDHQVFLAGVPVERQYAFAPPSGAAMSIALLSTGDVCTLGVVVDTTAIPDVEVLIDCLRDGVDEVVAVGRPRRRSR